VRKRFFFVKLLEVGGTGRTYDVIPQNSGATVPAMFIGVRGHLSERGGPPHASASNLSAPSII